MGRRVQALGAAAVAVCGLLSINPAHAVPTLQMYVEGAAYDPITDTWIGTVTPGDPFLRVWAIGQASPTANANQDEVTLSLKMTNLRMSVLFGGGVGSNEGNDADGRPIVVRAVGTDFNGFEDSWSPDLLPGVVGATMLRTLDIVTEDGSQLDTVLIDVNNPGDPLSDFLPIIGPKNSGPGNDLVESHGEFTDGRSWQEYNIPDMDFLNGTLRNIADFNGADPLPDADPGQSGILYSMIIDTSTFGTLDWHFDLYGVLSETIETTTTTRDRVCVQTGTRANGNPIFTCDFVTNVSTSINTELDTEVAPYSHDGGGVGTTDVPEPATLAVLGFGLIGAAFGLRRRVNAA